MAVVLGISAFYHDAAAAIVLDGVIIAAAQEERFTRVKNTSEFPVQAIKYCMSEAGMRIDDLDAVVFYEKPLLKMERLLETYYAFAPRGLRSFLKFIPVWLNDQLFIKKKIYDGLRSVEPYHQKSLKLLFSEHHLSHAASAFFASPFRESAILTIDGVGEWCTATIGKGTDNKIHFLKEMHFPHSVGLLYSAFTYFLGFKVNSGEYKMMGLAPYGRKDAVQTKTYKDLILSQLVEIKEDGSIWLNQDYFNYATGLTMIQEKKWEQLFGFPLRVPETAIEQYHCDLALAIQQVTEEIVLRMAREAKRITGADYLCMAGGVALNCVANGRLQREGLFRDIYIQPAAGDAGGALGAALAVTYMYFNQNKPENYSSDAMSGARLGPSFSDKEIETMNRRHHAVAERFASFDDLCNFTAARLADGYVVGWFQGRMEFGPRALGQRSILGDARNPEMQFKLNIKIKHREDFRPFAPVVLEEDAGLYFNLKTSSPYMQLVTSVREDRCYQQDRTKVDAGLHDRIMQQRSDIPAVTHLDYSARVQTVDETAHTELRHLLLAFKALTGYGLLVNTSFNVRGEPIVCTPADAYNCFMNTDMDYLIIGHYMYEKGVQKVRMADTTTAIKFSPD